MRTGRSLLSRLLLEILATLSLAGMGLGGDAAAARTLLEGGKKALNGRKYDEALTLLRKAFSEDPDLTEAAYWIAVAREKSKDERGALASYREFLSLLDLRGKPSPEEQRLKVQAEKRVDALSAGEREFEKVEDRHLDLLLAFARNHLVRNPDLARQAIEKVLAFRPKQPAALALLDRLAGKAPPEANILAEVREWRDLANDRSFGQSLITFAGGLLTLDATVSNWFPTKDNLSMKGAFAIDSEFRLVAAHQPNWFTGFVFARTESRWYGALVYDREVDLVLSQGGAPADTVGSVALDLLDSSTWHQFGIAVRGGLVHVWLDRRKVLEAPVPDDPEFGGRIGLIQQQCSTERRMLRVGAL